MYDCKRFYIDGQWVRPAQSDTLDVLDPATEATVGVISLGSRTAWTRRFAPPAARSPPSR